MEPSVFLILCVGHTFSSLTKSLLLFGLCVSSRSGVIEKLEALELENPEKMEVEEAGRGGGRQGRSEYRSYRQVCEPTEVIRPSAAVPQQDDHNMTDSRILQKHRF